VQFKRVEKFIKNYLDVGQVVGESIVDGKLLNEILYFDGTLFVGEMDVDEESNLAFKDGPGVLKRGTSLSYLTSVKGRWSRGMLHGKNVEFNFNLKLFPKGYYSNTAPKAESVKIIGEVNKGI
jgi:hypothetical protein